MSYREGGGGGGFGGGSKAYVAASKNPKGERTSLLYLQSGERGGMRQRLILIAITLEKKTTLARINSKAPSKKKESTMVKSPELQNRVHIRFLKKENETASKEKRSAPSNERAPEQGMAHRVWEK